MVDTASTLQRLALSRTLWLVIAWPLAGLLWQALWVRPRVARSRGADDVLRQLASARVAGVGCIALAATALVGHAVLLGRLPAGGRALFEALGRGARTGTFDAPVELLLDTRAAMAAGLACAVALAAAVVLARRPAPERGWRPWAWLQLALAGALVSFLADGFVPLAMGWGLVAAAGACLAGWHDARTGVVLATRGAVALAFMLLGGALLAWGLGGSWDEDGYDADGAARVVAAGTGTGTGSPTVTMTTFAGSSVFVDEERTASLRSPFVRALLPPGPHTFRVHDGDEDHRTARVDVSPGEELVIVPVGPTLSFHALSDQLALRDPSGSFFVRRTAEGHVGPGGVAVVAGALLLLLAAAGAMSAWSPPLAAPRVLAATAAGATTSAVGPFLLVRLALLFPSAPHTGAVVASVGAAVLLAAVWQALAFAGKRRWLAFAGGAPSGLALLALGLGGVVPAMEVLVVAGGAAAVIFLVAARAGEDEDAIDEASRVRQDEALLVRVPERLGLLLASMERWVVGAVASAIGGLARVAAWMVAAADEQLVALPGDLAATGVQRATARVVSWFGASPATVVWAVVALAALVVFLHAVWPGG